MARTSLLVVRRGFLGGAELSEFHFDFDYTITNQFISQTLTPRSGGSYMEPHHKSTLVLSSLFKNILYFFLSKILEKFIPQTGGNDIISIKIDIFLISGTLNNLYRYCTGCLLGSCDYLLIFLLTTEIRRFCVTFVL